VASRWPWRPCFRAASISASTSRSVRYSRGRSSAFGRRSGTVRFSMRRGALDGSVISHVKRTSGVFAGYLWQR
jgi:hypothetical protein